MNSTDRSAPTADHLELSAEDYALVCYAVKAAHAEARRLELAVGSATGTTLSTMAAAIQASAAEALTALENAVVVPSPLGMHMPGDDVTEGEVVKVYHDVPARHDPEGIAEVRRIICHYDDDRGERWYRVLVHFAEDREGRDVERIIAECDTVRGDDNKPRTINRVNRREVLPLAVGLVQTEDDTCPDGPTVLDGDDEGPTDTADRSVDEDYEQAAETKRRLG